ncbi:MAG: G8 domain-containing protein, partial [Acidobacteria bacterium]|nr:G8 domain-containing protein [Acidobacteriota bacterium]
TYDPALLSVTAVALGAAMPSGSTLVSDLTTPGTVVISVSIPGGLGAGAIDVVTLTAAVPCSAKYLSANVLDITQVSLNGGAIAAADDDGVHAVAYFGDATGNGGYSSLDSQRVQRVAVELDRGFLSYPLLDPVVIGDITGNGSLSGLDATRIQQEVVGGDRPETPPIPVCSSPLRTPYDTIPNFAANPTLVSVGSGPWSVASTWSAGRVPVANDVVVISPQSVVTYDVVSDEAIKTVAIRAGGQLRFRTDIDTRLRVTNLLVFPDGQLEVGSVAAPVAPNVKAEIIFNDTPLDTVFDPKQYGNGLIALGKVTMHGAAQNETFVRLAVEPRAGDTTLTLSQPVTGWRAGDMLVLPDTRQVDSNSGYVPQWEQLTLASVSPNGTVLTLSSPLQFDHLGARDGNGVLEFLPHVGNFTRNVVVHSEAHTGGTRGHVMFTYRADVDLRYVEFHDLGRTTTDPIDNTTFDSAGNVTHIGTNQIGRYSLHMHHLVGPATTPANGHQFTLIGNAIGCRDDANMNFKWGIAVHDSHYGLVKDNFVYNMGGEGIVAEDGSESFNVFEHNFVARIKGQSGRRIEGSGFWFRGPNNIVRDNVATNIYGKTAVYGFTVFAEYTGNQRVPAFPGADTTVPGQYVTVDMNATPFREFARNEAYGATRGGFNYWWIGAFGAMLKPVTSSGVLQDLRAWHINNWAIFGYESNQLVIDHLVVRGDLNLVNNDTIGVYLADYVSSNLVIRNADIQGINRGIVPSTHSGWAVQTIENSYFRTNIGVQVTSLWSSGYRSDWIPPRVVVLRNNTFVAARAGQQPIAVDMAGGNSIAQRDEVWVSDTAGNVFRLYQVAQDPNAVIATGMRYNSDGTPSRLAPPQDGLSVAQAWQLYGMAPRGAVAPSTATTRPEFANALVETAAAIPTSFDLRAPANWGLSVTSTTSSATVTWTSDEPALSLLVFGTAPATYTQAVPTTTPRTSHNVLLNNLQPGTYYGRLLTRDASGNWSAMTNEFSFTIV